MGRDDAGPAAVAHRRAHSVRSPGRRGSGIRVGRRFLPGQTGGVRADGEYDPTVRNVLDRTESRADRPERRESRQARNHHFLKLAAVSLPAVSMQARRSQRQLRQQQWGGILASELLTWPGNSQRVLLSRASALRARRRLPTHISIVKKYHLSLGD